MDEGCRLVGCIATQAQRLRPSRLMPLAAGAAANISGYGRGGGGGGGDCCCCSLCHRCSATVIMIKMMMAMVMMMVVVVTCLLACLQNGCLKRLLLLLPLPPFGDSEKREAEVEYSRHATDASS